MYARVARFEGADAEGLDRTASEIKAQSEEGPPEGVPAGQFFLLTDKEHGRSLGITLFETEEDYRQGDEAMNQMSPPSEGMGHRVSVEKYEVSAKLDA